eukprot:jgi/Mesvir1/22422/Mv17899-RA.2
MLRKDLGETDSRVHRPQKLAAGRALPPMAAASQETGASAASINGCVMLWYRVGDLRVHDHPGVARARERAAALGVPVVPVFIFDPSEAKHCRPDFLRLVHEAVADLRASLRSLGSDLVIRHGPADTALPSLARELRARVLVLSESLEWTRSREAAAVLSALGVAGAGVEDAAPEPVLVAAASSAASASSSGSSSKTLDTGKGSSGSKNSSSFSSSGGLEVIEWSTELRPWVPRPNSKDAPVPRNFAAYDVLKGDVADPAPTLAAGDLGSDVSRDPGDSGAVAPGIPPMPPPGVIPRGELPELGELQSWAGLPPSELEVQREKDEAAVRAQDEQLALERRTKEDSFASVRDSMAPVLPGQYYKDAVMPPYIPAGGETAALETLRGYLAFFDATLNPRWQRMYTLIQKKGVGTGFVEAVGPALALGCISPKRIRQEAMAYVAASKRTNPLSSVALRILEERDWQAHVARGDKRAGCQGPGWGLVGLYNVEMGDL